ncbi:unannotated protein [freshwater metagenome]|uniref:Unannotated protein n=1 Tax=freshwater metagenome TaxID=449393 RepID=A0A6J7RLE8_9ZZZZ
MSRKSPASETPPPITKAVGSKTAAKSANPRPSQVPTPLKASMATRSPSSAALVKCAPWTPSGVPSPSDSRRPASPRLLAARALASRTSALPLAYCSQHPLRPQAHGNPSGIAFIWPISPAAPCAPRNNTPSMMMPPPMPVPTVTIVKSSISSPAPNLNSPHAAAFPSFSTTTGRPTTSSSKARAGTFDQPRFGAKKTVDLAESTGPATPNPTPTTAPGYGALSSATTSATTARALFASLRGDSRRAVVTIAPDSSTKPAKILVPPTSTPTLKVISSA